MRYQLLITAASTLVLLFVAPPVTARAAGPCPASVSPAPAPETTSFYNNDKLLGPAELPKQGPVAKLLDKDKYDRFGGMPQADWDRTFINRDDKNNPTWRWPPTVSGFNPKWGPPYGTPNEKKRKLKTGTQLDRFGSEYGAFIAPAGASFAARALPPSSLNTFAAQTQSGYHLYCVAKPFEVDAGPIYPWFGQRGKATQFYLNKDYIPSMSCPEKKAPDDQCVKWLLANGYLNEVMPT